MTEPDATAEAIARDLLDEINREAEALLDFVATVNSDVGDVASRTEYRELLVAGAGIGSTAALTVLRRRGMLPGGPA